MKIERISVSRLRAYEQCPLYYDAVYNQGLSTSKEYLTFGVIVHEALEEYHKGTSDDLLELFNQAWRKYDLTNFSYYQDGLDLLRAYMMMPESDKSTVLVDDEGAPFLERYFNIALDESGDVIASGVIDRVNKINESAIEVLDYKTSRQPHSKEEMEKDLQLSIYNIAVNKLLPEYKEVRLSLLFLRHEEKLTTQRTDIELEDARQYFINMYYQILFNDNPQPKLNLYCAGCPIKNECSEYKNLTQNERLFLGEVPELLADVWAQLEDVKVKQKIINDRRSELEKIIENHLRVVDENHIVVGDKKIYLAGQKRSFYPYRVVEKALGAAKAKQLANVAKSKVDAAAVGNEKAIEILQRGKVTYFTSPSIQSSSLD